MSGETITFLSTRGRGLGIDLALIKSYLSKNPERYPEFRFYLNDETSSNPMAAYGFHRAKRGFCEGMTNAICLDASLEARMRRLLGEGKRILLFVPYDYQYKNMRTLESGRQRSRNTLAAFDYVLTGSPFSERLLRQSYRIREDQTLIPAALPFAWDLLQGERRRQVEKKIYGYFPEARGKKLVSVLVYGDEEKKRRDWEEFSLRDLFRQWEEDCFLFTNSELLMERSFSLSSRYRNRFGYINRVLPVQDMLYATDILITNNGRFAASYAARKKPVWACGYNDNSFEKYMAADYPSMFLNSVDRLPELPLAGECSAEQERFCRDMAYENPQSPYETVESLLGHV